MNQALNKRTIPVAWDENIIPHNIAQFKLQIRTGYNHARAKHPELPRDLTSFRQHNHAEAIAAKHKKKL